ncbi:PepSY domain-containing protein [Marinococcus luteus]|uniref:PepSY domain-containing protein n=1 Tax=Marinococcus luteus TaxID=1122204 RepID=UPI002ACC6748|nr:PepSY domain-containing protein [Marinococcus luteus]MDZ5783592.1 PepSY domain-containing protein [Marinococcus luteus]
MKNVIFLFVLMAGLIVSALGAWRFSPYFTPEMSPEEIEQAVQEQYQGDITSVEKQNGTYEVMTELDRGTYQLQVDAEDGAVTGVTRVAGNSTGDTEALTEEEARALAEEETDFSIEEISRETREGTAVYVVEFAEDEALEEITIDARSGDILEEKAEEDREERRQTVLSEQEAAAVAQEEVNGEVDDVDFEKSDAGEPFYYVELEQNDDDEATVQVHGITGEILSVTWDD